MSALTCAYLGRADEAVERLRNVWRLSPFDPLNFYFWIVAGIAEFVAGRYAEAMAWLRKSKRANPRFIACLRMLAASLALAGDEADARVSRARAARDRTVVSGVGVRIVVSASAGGRSRPPRGRIARRRIAGVTGSA